MNDRNVDICGCTMSEHRDIWIYPFLHCVTTTSSFEKLVQKDDGLGQRKEK